MSIAPQTPLLEIVICTYNNCAALDGVLSKLAAQESIENHRWSCLVVDNNCTDGTSDVVRRHVIAGNIPGLRLVRESEQGLTPARLCGVRNSSAPWIAFIDDDCFLQRDWVAQAVAFAESHPAAGAFGGKVILDWQIEPPAYVRPFRYCFAEQNRGDSVLKVQFLAGAGLVVNRFALSACGWSDAPLVADRVGANLVSGGDMEIVLRIASSGRELWYVPQCQLHHQIPARRTSIRYLVSMNRNLGISQTLADALVFEGSVTGLFFQSGRHGAREIVGLVKLAVRGMRRTSSRAEALIQAAFPLGRLQGLYGIARMLPARRRELMGCARRRTVPEGSNQSVVA